MLKIGIAGYGKIGRIRAQEIEKTKEAQVIAIYDISKPDDLNEDILFCDSFDKLIQQEIEAVFICTYNNVLADYTCLALKAGKHVFCEKPPARTSEELRKVIETEKQQGKILKYGFNHRYHYSVIEAPTYLFLE